MLPEGKMDGDFPMLDIGCTLSLFHPEIMVVCQNKKDERFYFANSISFSSNWFLNDVMHKMTQQNLLCLLNRISEKVDCDSSIP